MKPIDCEQLDDYLAGDLPCDWVAVFEQHVGQCPACSAEVTQWKKLGTDLQQASQALEAPSAALMESIRESCEPTRAPPREPTRARRLAAAVAVCLTAGLWLAVIPGGRESSRPPKEDHVVAVPKGPITRVELPDNVIGVPVDIGDPDVTVVWVYPVYDPAGESD